MCFSLSTSTAPPSPPSSTLCRISSSSYENILYDKSGCLRFVSEDKPSTQGVRVTPWSTRGGSSPDYAILQPPDVFNVSNIIPSNNRSSFNQKYSNKFKEVKYSRPSHPSKEVIPTRLNLSDTDNHTSTSSFKLSNQTKDAPTTNGESWVKPGDVYRHTQHQTPPKVIQTHKQYNPQNNSSPDRCVNKSLDYTAPEQAPKSAGSLYSTIENSFYTQYSKRKQRQVPVAFTTPEQSILKVWYIIIIINFVVPS